MKFKFNSVVFSTNRLAEIRKFYEGKLGFPTGFYMKDGKQIPDYSDRSVNYHIGGGLVGFEVEDDSTPPSSGDLVINVGDMDEIKSRIEKAGIKILKDTPAFLIIKDPDGRSIIFEPS
jgi:catechol 2,3-dioxygenase-like lactoylglutathione lyase family enzyme